ncbi:hypothetical protein LEN26_016666 [Aphanomyces euteiches]|nr:hypothetical protein LEN26_016666 [Aphanomyces euteiches]KAH9114978.1 hypothetical protein AeMF1_010964 [Aphanomyces euteiches]KAH9195936.1 hypothetical protein AeNC1_002085 [Aphanomyces euteiches]
MPILSEDVTSKIAFFIAESDDLFAFLEALRPFHLLGPLEHLWQLSLTHSRARLWPKLALSALDLTSMTTLRAVEAIAKHYSCVSVTNSNDIKWLQTHLHPKVKLEWSIESDPLSMQYWNDWSSLHTTKLSITVDSIDSALLVNALPHLKHLKSLSISSLLVGETWLSQLLALAATSDHLESLELLTPPQDITAGMVRDTITWFSRRPVRVFRIRSWTWAFDDIVLLQAFFDTIFNCPTLDRLDVANVSLEDIDFANASLSMRSLQLEDCSLTSSQIISLATRLERSTVEDLTIAVHQDLCLDGFLHFLRRLHLFASIQSLELAFHGSMFHAWTAFAPLFQLCQSSSLTLRGGSFNLQSLSLLGIALSSNLSIRHVQLPGWLVDFHDICNFINMTTIPKRAVNMESIRIDDSYISATDKLSLHQIAVARGVQLHI